MTLSDRIADVRRKAVAYRDVNATSSAYTRVWADLYNAMSADLIIQMADRLEELETQAHLSSRACEMSANILRDKRRTKATGAVAKMVERIARQFDRIGRDLRTASRALKSKEPKL